MISNSSSSSSIVKNDPHVAGTTGFFDDNMSVLESPTTLKPILRTQHMHSCNDSYDSMPLLEPHHWPQAPIMLRPTPNAKMIIRGVRYSNSTTYESIPGLYATGCVLPINTGYELPGQSFVVDFESPLFIGTLLVRVKGATSINTDTNNSTHDTFLHDSATTASTPGAKRSSSYFDGKKRQFHVIVKGRFKQNNIPMSECVTGQMFDRPAGKLPARFIVNSFIKFITTLAPQLEVELDGHQPRFLSPLVATAHTVIVKDNSTNSKEQKESLSESKTKISICDGSSTMEDDVEEPPSNDPFSVMTMLQSSMNTIRTGPTSVLQRRATRKKVFNRLAAMGDSEHVFGTDKEYTFEFYQHLLLLSKTDEFKIDMGRNIQIGLSNALNGQPIKILAARRQKRGLTDKCANKSIADVLWSFDLWHQSLHSVACHRSVDQTIPVPI